VPRNDQFDVSSSFLRAAWALRRHQTDNGAIAVLLIHGISVQG
jgi:hypothetical protein